MREGRYRQINNLGDFSHDMASFVDFIGEGVYRKALKKIHADLDSKGFVTQSDDACSPWN